MKFVHKWLSKWREIQSKKETAYFGTSLYDELTINPLPSLLLITAVVLFFVYSLPYAFYLGKFFFWFVGVLEITKVLKIPFLDELRYYHYLSAFVYFYIATSLLIDVSRLLNKWNKRTVFVKNEIWQIQRYRFGKKLIKINFEPNQIQLGYEHGGLSDFLGCNRMVWEKDGNILLTTPFFFPYKKNKIIVNRVLNR
ncbi:LIMLP_18675 family protein [Leptospira meyeri]|uniref:Uncharacterized protein n=1 Tax=Leptospira meyeri TaxID=29508 RepID=A0A4R8MRT9_LEPME|nr:hypothetical protein [Leptospira meyeri]EKJ85964.1 hypothetical protein LEP1GSC017_0215 [Leptospira meyeri serovar Hardjo str. Went 5]EMJ87477.1 hypothetical protein LEP1GSC196_0632 [Leptospira meyeri serovar Semaranga str. Veldrot Semarang 173]TDY68466.1 hypothetical protein CLV96_2980 [Leptospira meyeri]TGL48573.1 hypothetical protein EHQ55_09960 [Leptospira meyeri]